MLKYFAISYLNHSAQLTRYTRQGSLYSISIRTILLKKGLRNKRSVPVLLYSSSEKAVHKTGKYFSNDCCTEVKFRFSSILAGISRRVMTGRASHYPTVVGMFI